jgi:hypothetical protein
MSLIGNIIANGAGEVAQNVLANQGVKEGVKQIKNLLNDKTIDPEKLENLIATAKEKLQTLSGDDAKSGTIKKIIVGALIAFIVTKLIQNSDLGKFLPANLLGFLQ